MGDYAHLRARRRGSAFSDGYDAEGQLLYDAADNLLGEQSLHDDPEQLLLPPLSSDRLTSHPLIRPSGYAITELKKHFTTQQVSCPRNSGVLCFLAFIHGGAFLPTTGFCRTPLPGNEKRQGGNSPPLFSFLLLLRAAG
ncbi:hypothetical protein [Erwinia pyrifoliae]|uniref:Uncharacterized protein n=1 Tax=Erwinia pyrifoliae TaxID=79967 RepID=A0ABY5XAP0_ERWPY|nr:hypothetical protein [Erwinia pyrifoliae]AUX73355.1 hypothetical protein CPI84_13290 [Erwinia pyrifoliae]MCA8876353.1 hypothetical protein [Erwinia pyrifoliae]UWS28319.1 hypothetical protein NYP81_10095 [Erwinia pyrifoliae]UWS34471.1 hypothetical protein NYP84_04650 [Erwinia pyrifoliae]UXK11322.1 hypothetical protein NYP80_13475 [Erwinia pyrifoliae]